MASADLPGESHHLYVHVPFCRLVCAYCDFVTVGGRAAEIPRYTNALLAELRMRPAPGQLRTVYLGGGTPSLLPAAQVACILEAAKDRWADVSLDEVTLEANPGAREAPDWLGLRLAGVTRISLGLQSLRDPELRALARGHGADESRAAFEAARRAGFENIGVDLIYGIPGQSLDDWRDGLARAIALRPEHLSLYALQLAMSPDEWAAPPRRGALRWRHRMAKAQDADLAADQYELAEELLAEARYRHYELSSWAVEGHESRHNGAYWSRRAYTGIGAGAHSFDGERRSWNTRDLDAYLSRVELNGAPTAGAETLDEATRAFEAIALGLRRTDGLSRREFAAEFRMDPLQRFAAPIADGAAGGFLEVRGDSLRLTRRGRLMASDVLIGFLPVAQPPPAVARAS